MHLPELLNVFGKVIVQKVDVIDWLSVIDALRFLTEPGETVVFPRRVELVKLDIDIIWHRLALRLIVLF